MASSKKLTKVLGTVGKIISVLPDTTEIIGRTIDNARPIVEKELERHHERKNDQIPLDNVVHLDIHDAKEHLEKQGFVVRQINLPAKASYSKYLANQVIKMVPSSKTTYRGSLVKLYYCSQEAINASSILAEKKAQQPNLEQKIVNSVSSVGNLFKKDSQPSKRPRKDVTNSQ